MEILENFYHETQKSVLGCSISHYLHLHHTIFFNRRKFASDLSKTKLNAFENFTKNKDLVIKTAGKSNYLVIIKLTIKIIWQRHYHSNKFGKLKN